MVYSLWQWQQNCSYKIFIYHPLTFSVYTCSCTCNHCHGLTLIWHVISLLTRCISFRGTRVYTVCWHAFTMYVRRTHSSLHVCREPVWDVELFLPLLHFLVQVHFTKAFLLTSLVDRERQKKWRRKGVEMNEGGGEEGWKGRKGGGHFNSQTIHLTI